MILQNRSPTDRRHSQTGIRSNGNLRVKGNRIARYKRVPPGRRTVDHAIVRMDSVPAPDSHNRDSKIAICLFVLDDSMSFQSRCRSTCKDYCID